jgi:molybdopterin molybdotransferase
MKHDVRMSGFVERRTFREVWQILRERIGPGETESVGLREALGRVIADDVISPVDVPGFDRSAMDGYAVRGEETSGASDYNPLGFRVVGEAFPGREFRGGVGPGEAVKIMTGSAVPEGANAVVMAEHVEKGEGRILVRSQVQPGKNVVRAGEDLRRGELVLSRGQRLRPQDLGVLASVRRGEARVYRRPTVSILVTGNELVESGRAVPPGHIPDSNSHVIGGVVVRYGGVPVFGGIVPDSRDAIRAAILGSKDELVVVSGGSSVGEEDYAPLVVQELGELAVHGVAMRPGGPFGMGFIDGRPVFLLPGSPVAAMVTADAFVGSAIRRRLGLDVGFDHRRVPGVLKQKVVSAIGRTDFVRVRVNDDFTVERVRVSGAGVLSSTTRADGFVVIEDGVEGFPEGAVVTVYVYDL